MIELADTGLWVRRFRREPAARTALDEAAERGQLALCDPVRVELLAGMPNPHAVRAMRALLATRRSLPVASGSWERAMDVQELLARLRGGRHRDVPLADLLIAATAEIHDAVLLHDDFHMDLITAVTGQRAVRIPPV